MDGDTRKKAASILNAAAAQVSDLGIHAEVDDYGQAVFYPPEGYDFDIDPETGALTLIHNPNTDR